MRPTTEHEIDEEMAAHEQSLCELSEAQRAIVLLADQLERHSVPFVPEAEAATLKARRDQEQMRRLEAIGMRAARDVFAHRQRTTEDTDR